MNNLISNLREYFGECCLFRNKKKVKTIYKNNEYIDVVIDYDKSFSTCNISEYDDIIIKKFIKKNNLDVSITHKFEYVIKSNKSNYFIKIKKLINCYYVEMYSGNTLVKKTKKYGIENLLKEIYANNIFY